MGFVCLFFYHTKEPFAWQALVAFSGVTGAFGGLAVLPTNATALPQLTLWDRYVLLSVTVLQKEAALSLAYSIRLCEWGDG